MNRDIQNDRLILDGISIPLLADDKAECEIVVPYMLHSAYIYRFSQCDEAHLLRRILINGLVPEQRLCKSRIINTPKHKIDHPYHWGKLGKEFLKRHYCILPDGTNKNCWLAYKDGDFPAISRKERIYRQVVPRIGGYVSACLMAATCFYSCAFLLGQATNGFALTILIFLTMISAIPFIHKISKAIEEFSFLTVPTILMIIGAVIEKISNGDATNMFISLWGALGSIGTIICLGVGGIACIIFAFMLLFDIFHDKYL